MAVAEARTVEGGQAVAVGNAVHRLAACNAEANHDGVAEPQGGGLGAREGASLWRSTASTTAR
jgi:hypothetical protein